jgi:hypothetical protein
MEVGSGTQAPLDTARLIIQDPPQQQQPQQLQTAIVEELNEMVAGSR